jgi:hypothetical protein
MSEPRHVCDPWCFYWPGMCPITPKTAVAEEARPADLPINLADAMETVGAAYAEGMRRAGMLEGLITLVHAYAGEQLREVYATADDAAPDPG